MEDDHEACEVYTDLDGVCYKLEDKSEVIGQFAFHIYDNKVFIHFQKIHRSASLYDKLFLTDFPGHKS